LYAPLELINRPGVLVMVQGDSGLPPAYTDENGFATLGNLPREDTGCSSNTRIQILDHRVISVPGGQTVEMPDQTLTTSLIYLPVIRK